MNPTQIGELIDFIKDNTTLKAIFSDRVAYHSFVNEQTETSLMIRDLTDDRKQVSSESLLEFRIIAPEKTVGPLDVKTYLSQIMDVFTQVSLQIGDSNYYQVDSLSDLYVEQNVKSQYEGVTTFIFKNTK